MAQRSGRVREWIGRYLVAELAGLTTALLAAIAVTSWDPDRLAIAAYASALGEGVGFYAGFLIVRYLREEIDGPPRRRIAVIVAAAVVEFGPAEIVDTVLIRPAAMFLASLATGNVIIGVLIGKVAADIVFYGLAITSYEVLVRRFLHRFRRHGSVDDGAATGTRRRCRRPGPRRRCTRANRRGGALEPAAAEVPQTSRRRRSRRPGPS